MEGSFYEKALLHFGIENCAEKLIEEMAELIVELKHFRDEKTTVHNVRKEIADVNVQLNIVALYFGVKEIDDITFDIKRKVDDIIDAKCREWVEGESDENH